MHHSAQNVAHRSPDFGSTGASEGACAPFSTWTTDDSSAPSRAAHDKRPSGCDDD
jgi:hypothetical protein